MKWVVGIAALLFGSVAYNEWSYANHHAYAYGPAKEIMWASVAGIVVCVCLYLMDEARTELDEKIDAVTRWVEVELKQRPVNDD